MGETHDLLTHGCYVVTTILEGRRYGMTCTWATQIDEDEVLLVLGQQSTTREAIKKSGKFGVSVLTVEQKALALRFGEAHSEEVDKFAGVETVEGETGVPLLKGAGKTLECEWVATAIPSDRSLIVGRVVHFRQHAAGIPLLLRHVDEDSNPE